jgi:hypothetical protein
MIQSFLQPGKAPMLHFYMTLKNEVNYIWLAEFITISDNYLAHDGYLSATVTSKLHIAATRAFIIVWPIKAHRGSYFQIVNPIPIIAARRRKIETSLERVQNDISATVTRDPTNIPRTGSPESITSFDRCMLKSGIKWHSGSSPRK